METTKMPQSGPSPLGIRLRLAAACILLPAMALGVTLGCGPATKASAPTVTTFTPGYGNTLQGTEVTIYGTGFSQGLQQVYFGGAPVTAAPTGSDIVDTQFTVYVPLAAVTGDITVTTSGGSANSPSEFFVVPALSLNTGSSIVSASTTVTYNGNTYPAGGVGSTVTIQGQGLSGIGPITIKGTGAGGLLTVTPTTQNANEIIFTIPTGATVDANNGEDPNTITINNDYGLTGVAPIAIQFDVTPV